MQTFLIKIIFVLKLNMVIVIKNYSIWSDINMPSYSKLSEDIKTDVLVIGGGITGILCAYELKKRKINCVLVEKDKIGKGISKNTTAFLSVHHDYLYQDMIKELGFEKTQEFYYLNQKAIQKYKELSKKFDFDFKDESSVIYSVNKDIIKKEKEALELVGCTCSYTNNLPINIEFNLGLRIPDSGSIHPLKCIKEISKELTIYENTEIKKIKNDIAYTSTNRIFFKKVIIATHYPFINKKSLYFMKIRQARSYVAVINNYNFDGNYCSIDNNSLYFRTYNNKLIIGGNDRDTKIDCKKNFVDRINLLFPNKEIEYSWSNQDCITLDKIPYIGKYDLFHDNWYITTGFNLWGFTWAMVSSFVLADLIENKNYYPLVNPNRRLKGKQLFKNVLTSIKYICNFKTPRCTHLGCSLKYNKIEKTWECPCHGSRYDKDGKLLNGPAKKDINS